MQRPRQALRLARSTSVRYRWTTYFPAFLNVNTRSYTQSSGGASTDSPPNVNEPPSSSQRPSWIFASSSLLRVVLVPVGLAYAVFVHDFGEEEHVFMPPRRWLQRQKEAFFTLSPAEKRLVAADSAVVEGDNTSASVSDSKLADDNDRSVKSL